MHELHCLQATSIVCAHVMVNVTHNDRIGQQQHSFNGFFAGQPG